ncbi:hypothetical protein HYH03_015908 [Edaphochlamys debaryana]|uniref:Uncharacterized protein n=1 Tax=Edaphochlamys debaryana TaxID=47281 RepID=A0A835XK50_9CHLO|nr:hypothetical protein HYH03_015908 [Edaphochlamys debaryana]|eukprot:KAG2485326.1 hypothetical protein HYH03_015908 [Edaphochlamys debaryana]
MAPPRTAPAAPPRPRSPALAVALPLLLLAAAAGLADAFTRPDQLAALNAYKDANINRSASWRKTLSKWTCPTDPADSDQACDPCSKDWSGNWEFIHCRGTNGPYGEGSTGDFNGLITNVHITDQQLEGPVPREICYLQYLRELDLDGSNFNGPFPEFVFDCMPQLQELDLSYNRLTGMLPTSISSVTRLQEFKVEYNEFMGPIPKAFADLANLRVLRLEANHLTGTVPPELNRLSSRLNILHLAHNQLKGELTGLSNVRLMQVTTDNNAGLCGMVPAGIRFANGFNPYGTRLGQPCD